MPAPIDVLYTTIGGVIGAALTQYVTHLRDRRAARALVVERLADVEEAFEALHWALPPDGTQPPAEPQMAGKLAALEAASLVAGIPRSIYACYASTIKCYENSRRILQAETWFALQTVQSANDNLAELRESKDNVAANLESMRDHLITLSGQVKTGENGIFKIHDAALKMLSKALWKPNILPIRWWKLRGLKQRVNRLDSTACILAEKLRKYESAYKAVSIGSFNIAEHLAADWAPSTSEG